MIKIINKKEFAKATLDENIEDFVMYVMSFSLNLIAINLAKKALVALLVAKKVQIPTEYLDFSDVFLEEKILIL